jgi:hypothetical protein
MMAAVERIIRARTTETGCEGCPRCRSTGLISYWSEISFFEDRRICTECEEGQKADAKIAEIIDRAMRKERIVRR